jgi:hypothetical protein
VTALRADCERLAAENDGLRDRIMSMQAHEFVHKHECPHWRLGSKHGPCTCGHDHRFESNPGMYDTQHRYCAICGVAE